MIPAGRFLAGAGTRRNVTLFNCFVMGAIPDDRLGVAARDRLMQRQVESMQFEQGLGAERVSGRYETERQRQSAARIESETNVRIIRDIIENPGKRPFISAQALKDVDDLMHLDGFLFDAQVTAVITDRLTNEVAVNQSKALADAQRSEANVKQVLDILKDNKSLLSAGTIKDLKIQIDLSGTNFNDVKMASVLARLDGEMQSSRERGISGCGIRHEIRGKDLFR